MLQAESFGCIVLGMGAQMKPAMKKTDPYCSECGLDTDRYCSLHAAAPEMLTALEAIYALVDAGVLVRDTSHDHEPGWAIKALPLVKALQNAQAVIAKAKRESA